VDLVVKKQEFWSRWQSIVFAAKKLSKLSMKTIFIFVFLSLAFKVFFVSPRSRWNRVAKPNGYGTNIWNLWNRCQDERRKNLKPMASTLWLKLLCHGCFLPRTESGTKTSGTVRVWALYFGLELFWGLGPYLVKSGPGLGFYLNKQKSQAHRPSIKPRPGRAQAFGLFSKSPGPTQAYF
jgi:hypothetical protein